MLLSNPLTIMRAVQSHSAGLKASVEKSGSLNFCCLLSSDKELAVLFMRIGKS